jgi:hypothetical protein
MDEMGDKIFQIEEELETEVGMELLESEVVDWPMVLSYFVALLPIYCYPVWVSSLPLLQNCILY